MTGDWGLCHSNLSVGATATLGLAARQCGSRGNTSPRDVHDKATPSGLDIF